MKQNVAEYFIYFEECIYRGRGFSVRKMVESDIPRLIQLTFHNTAVILRKFMIFLLCPTPWWWSGELNTQLTLTRRQGYQYLQCRIVRKFLGSYIINLPITVAVRSKVWTVFTHSNTRIVGSNPTQGMDVCAFICICVVLRVGSGLATGRSPAQGVLPTVYWLSNWKNSQGPQEL
jgi:hypothetical protein